MRRAFALGSGEDRKVVVLELDGARMRVTQKKGEGESKRSEKELKSEAEALIAFGKMAQELTSRGFVEKAIKASPASASKPAQASKPAPPAAKPKPAPAKRKAEEAPPPLDLYALDGAEDEEPVASAAPVLARQRAPEPAAKGDGAKPKKKGGKKKKKKANPDGLDKRVLAGAGAVGAALVLLAGYFVYDIFLKPHTIVGVWAGSMIEFETGGPMSHTEYRLVLDAQKRASLTLQGDITSTGTYSVKGDRLMLDLVEEDDEKDAPPEPAEPDAAGEGEDEGEGDAMPKGEGQPKAKREPSTSRQEFKIALGRSSLDLFDPESGKRLVQLIRFREEPIVGGGKGGAGGPAPAAPKDIAGAGDPAADAKLASVEFAPKDNAFKLRHPTGWGVETGSRPDNTYSWATLTKDSATIKVFADVTGSLMAGAANPGQHEEGSELAPVHNAHMMYRKTISEEYNEYKESDPTLFKGSSLGEGRIATFGATEGAIFGSSLKGYRVTLLTNDRRITVLCQCPVGEFEQYKPTFLAVCRSLQR